MRTPHHIRIGEPDPDGGLNVDRVGGNGQLVCQDGQGTVGYTAGSLDELEPGQRIVLLEAYIDDPELGGTRGPSTELLIPNSSVSQDVEIERTMTGGGEETDGGKSVAVGPGGSVYVAGTSDGELKFDDLIYVPPAGKAYGFVGRSTTAAANGDSPFASTEWLEAVTSATGADVSSISADRAGDVYASGRFLKNLGLGNLVL